VSEAGTTADEKSGAARTDRVAALIVILGVAFACGRAALAKPIENAPRATEELKKSAFFAMAGDERKMRRDAAKDFPADAWSQDDAFHNFEFKKARDVASDKKMPLEDVLSAIDEGMREHWPRPRGVVMNPSVPPCRPRPIH
jgi:hypothetical protein